MKINLKFPMAIRTAALLLAGFAFFCNSAQAGEKGVNYFVLGVQGEFIDFTDHDNLSWTCTVIESKDDGTFKCGSSFGSEPTASGKVIGVTDSLGNVIAYKFTLTHTVSPSVTEQYTGSINGSQDTPGYLSFIAGTYQKILTKYLTINGVRTAFKSTMGPYPFEGRNWYVQG